jgi:hypothetical protein
VVLLLMSSQAVSGTIRQLVGGQAICEQSGYLWPIWLLVGSEVINGQSGCLWAVMLLVDGEVVSGW